MRYNAACALALAGDAPAALALLQQLAAAQPRGGASGGGANGNGNGNGGASRLVAADVAADADLAALRPLPAFGALLAGLEALAGAGG